MLRPFVASIMVSPPCLKKIRRRVFHLHFPIFTNMFVKSRAPPKEGHSHKLPISRVALFLCAVYLTCRSILRFFFSFRAKGNGEETRIFIGNLKSFAFGHLSVVKYLQIVTPRLSSCFSLLVITKLFGRKCQFKQRGSQSAQKNSLHKTSIFL